MSNFEVNFREYGSLFQSKSLPSTASDDLLHPAVYSQLCNFSRTKDYILHSLYNSHDRRLHGHHSLRVTPARSQPAPPPIHLYYNVMLQQYNALERFPLNNDIVLLCLKYTNSAAGGECVRLIV